MSYEEILEKIRAARELAESKKKAHFNPTQSTSKGVTSPKEEIVWEEKKSQETP